MIKCNRCGKKFKRSHVMVLAGMIGEHPIIIHDRCKRQSPKNKKVVKKKKK